MSRSGEPLGARRARLEPGVLVGGVVDDQLDHDLHVALVGGVEELLEVVERAVGGVDVDVVGDVVAVVAQGRGEEGQEPEAGDAEVLEVVEAGDQAGEVADAVAVGVLEGADVQLIDDRVFVPERVGGAAGFLHVRVASWVGIFAVGCRAEGAGGCASSMSYQVRRMRKMWAVACGVRET